MAISPTRTSCIPRTTANGTTKRHIYARYGVRFYWLVDPEEETIRVFEVKDGAYGEPVTLKPGQQLCCALVPGITQDVGQLFAEP